MLTTVLLARSTWPEEIGWWLIWSLACIPRSFHTSCMILVVKWVPRSELTLKGSPNLEKMWFINRLYHWELGGILSTLWIRRPRWGSICYPVLTVAGVLPSLFGDPTTGRSFLSFAVGLGGLDLPVGTGNTPGILSCIPLRLAACQASMLLAWVFHRWPWSRGVLRMVHRGRVSASSPFGYEGLRALA